MLLTTFSKKKILLTDTSLTVIGDLSNKEYVEAFRELITINNKSNWYIGDLLNDLEAKGRDLLTTIGDEVGFNHRSLDNIKSLCRRIPKDQRIEGISWSHHEKALTECGKQLKEMAETLVIAKTNNYSVKEMVKGLRERHVKHALTIIPPIERSRHEIGHSEAMNSIASIKRYANNNYKHCDQPAKDEFKRDWNDLVKLVEATI